MRLVKVFAVDLKSGMFVAELDRPWLDSPFLLQGFVIRDAADVREVSKHVEFVYVDSEYSGAERFLVLDTSQSAKRSGNPLAIKDDYETAEVAFESAADTLDRIFDSLRQGRHSNISAVQDAVNPLIQGIFRNQEAVAALLRLKKTGEYRYSHGISMALWAVILGRQIGLHRTELEKLAVGCAMCDIGMTELPQELLDHPDKLSDQQRLIVRKHTEIGSQMVADSDDVDMEIIAIIENHHERMDGSGYPKGLSGAQIPLLARIAGMVDTYDAMVSSRKYASERTSHEAAQELLDAKGTAFQASMVEQFVQAIGLFPTGVLVELNTKEVGIVVKQHQTRRLKPEIVIVLDENKQRKEILTTIDLSRQDIQNDGERWINRELIAGSYGVNSQEFFI